MKDVGAAMLAVLKSAQFYKANLYTVELATGQGALHYCGGDRDIVANGIRYSASGTFGSGTVGGPYFDTENNIMKLHQKIGVDVDSLTFDVIAGNATVGGVPFLRACKNGVFDSAIITVERAYMPNYGDTSAGTIVVFKGRVGSVNIGRTLATFNVNSFLELLNVDLPRNVYQAACINTLGDVPCGVTIANYAVSLTVGPGSSQSSVAANTASINQAASYYGLGRVTFTNGTLTGVTRTVSTYTLGSPGSFSIIGVFPSTPEPGATFTLTPGCNKSLDANGCAKFSNTARFRGFRFIPQPTTAF